jgi:hypothetical protein
MHPVEESMRVTRRVVLLVLGLGVVPHADASEIPAFARKYRVSCATCHAPMPRLNATGEAFAANGFEFAPGEEPRDTIATGDPLLRLQNNIPLAIRYDAYMTAISNASAGQVVVDQQLPWVMKLLSGGQVSNKISYYAYFLLSERGEVAGLEDAYVQFTDVRGTGVSVIAGQFQVSDPLFKRELRLAYEDYQPYRVRVGDSPADLTYDRGVMAFWSPRSGTDLAFQVVSGQGLNIGSAYRQYDRDGSKSFGLRLSQDIGPARVGAFGYVGRDAIGGNAQENSIRVWGPDATLPLGSVGELNLQALRRWDDNPFLGRCTTAAPCPGGLASAHNTRVDAGFAEALFWPGGPAGRWYFSALANYVESDRPVVSLRLAEQAEPAGFLQRYVTAGFGAHYLLRRNVRLLGEGQWDFEREQPRLVAGLSAAF